MPMVPLLSPKFLRLKGATDKLSPKDLKGVEPSEYKPKITEMSISFWQAARVSIIDAALNTIDERFKENELDIFRSLKDVKCSNSSKIIKNVSVQRVSETYDLDMEKNKGGDTNFSENVYKKYIDSLPEISTEITELRKRCNILVEKELCDIHISILDKTNPNSPCDTCLNYIMCEKFFMLKIFKIIP
ncbi:hypothetical protein AVEN_138979-1 [Araneus ventricosus]|uniref:Uncharacterized protein n=1 Tax=Araneus ventricosus TaxID=182803 RepID=A0A4Y2VZ85_ARAVE|nr:hypothetical protein AVEN_138979-1 [Araneus ventricosus]